VEPVVNVYGVYRTKLCEPLLARRWDGTGSPEYIH